jgi:SPP1 family predicted phage head-tail adaptor
MALKKDPLALAAGDLRHTITFLQRAITTDASGSVPTWTTYATMRAAVDPYSARELMRSGVDVTQTLITVTCRYRNDVNSTMRIQTLSGTYIISGIENVQERNRVLKITCTALGTDN